MKGKRKIIFIIISIVIFLFLACLVFITLNPNDSNKISANNDKIVNKQKDNRKQNKVKNQEEKDNNSTTRTKNITKTTDTKKDNKKQNNNGAGQKTDIDSAVFACPKGYTSLDGDNITYTTICVKSLPAEAKCDSGYVVLNGKCQKEEQYSACEEEYVYDGEVCYNKSCPSAEDCEADIKDASCLGSDVLTSDGKCLKYSFKDIKYSCENITEKGFMISGSSCNKYTKAMKQ